jgi:hypothetical protein
MASLKDTWFLDCLLGLHPFQLILVFFWFLRSCTIGPLVFVFVHVDTDEVFHVTVF